MVGSVAVATRFVVTCCPHPVILYLAAMAIPVPLWGRACVGSQLLLDKKPGAYRIPGSSSSIHFSSNLPFPFATILLTSSPPSSALPFSALVRPLSRSLARRPG